LYLKRLSHNSIIKQLSDTFICFQPHITIRNQNWLFHPTIADLIEEDHICRLVDDVVESIDFKSIEGKYDGPGSPAYQPKVMMKLLIHGTIDGIRSFRKIYRVRAKTVERLFGHVKQNIGLREFLTRGLQGVRAEFNHHPKICVEALKGYGPKFYLLLATV
jgi:hypothetical protein